TGFTGHLVGEEFGRRGLGFVLAGRDAAALGEQAEELRTEYGVETVTRVATTDDDASLDAMLDGVDVLINCAGPFTDCGPPVARAAIRNRVHYLDTTGEQAFMRWLAEECHDEAVEAGTVVIAGCAFEYAVGDLAAELALRQGASRIVVCYAPRNLAMSPGTKKSVVRSISDPGFTYVDGHLEKKRPGYRLFDVPFPDGSTRKGAWFPGGEPLQVARRGGVSWVESCLAIGDGKAYFIATFSGVIPTMMKMLKPVADRVAEQSEGDPHESPQGEPDFLVIAFDPKTGRHWATLGGRDVYLTTAKIIVEAATRLTKKVPAKKGFTSPSAIFDADSFIEAVGLEIVRVGDE
ncbi:MAG: saccharopine dehydrogenase family protein, partial [Bradymonadaceae bacterium]